jgi:hypothetical protein
MRDRMKTPSPIRRIPWRTIGWILLSAAIVAWSVGFLAGLFVRWQFGS